MNLSEKISRRLLAWSLVVHGHTVNRKRKKQSLRLASAYQHDGIQGKCGEQIQTREHDDEISVGHKNVGREHALW